MTALINIPSTFEGAICTAIIRTTLVQELPRIRTWQSIDAEDRWSPDNDRAFPVIDIRAKPPVTNGEDKTCSVPVQIIVMTSIDDDKTHRSLSDHYGNVQSVLDAIYSDDWHDPKGAALISFLEHVGVEMIAAGYQINIGGFEFGEASYPFIEEGANAISMEFIIHYSRSDF